MVAILWVISVYVFLIENLKLVMSVLFKITVRKVRNVMTWGFAGKREQTSVMQMLKEERVRLAALT
jgi:hypothetical protein